eukprot:2775227-Pyramimonas_sp.AAC.1
MARSEFADIKARAQLLLADRLKQFCDISKVTMFGCFPSGHFFDVEWAGDIVKKDDHLGANNLLVGQGYSVEFTEDARMAFAEAAAA